MELFTVISFVLDTKIINNMAQSGYFLLRRSQMWVPFKPAVTSMDYV